MYVIQVHVALLIKQRILFYIFMQFNIYLSLICHFWKVFIEVQLVYFCLKSSINLMSNKSYYRSTFFFKSLLKSVYDKE